MRIHPQGYLRGLSSTLTKIKGSRFISIVGQWPWRLESVKECVITHLPNEPVPKMDGAKAWSRRCPAAGLSDPKGSEGSIAASRRVWGFAAKRPGDRERSLSLAQISVVVANTRMKGSRAVVEKGFTRTTDGSEVVGPKGPAKA